MDNQHTFSIEISNSLQQPAVDPASINLGSFKSNYRKSLPSKIEQIETLLTSPENNNLGNLKQLYVKFYHLAGTSGTFGITDVSVEAGKLVSLLQPVVDTDQMMEPDLILNLERGFQSLREAAIEASTKDLDLDSPAQKPVPHTSRANTSQLSEVFLLDGDSDITTYMALYLEKLGHRVYTFQDPKELLTVSQGIRPKVVIIDLVFQDGVVEGAQVIKALQKHQKTPVPVIFTSFRDDVQARVLAAGALGTYFFKKPIDEDRLLLTLDRIAFQAPTFNARVLLVNSNLARGDKQLEAFHKDHIETMLLQDPVQLFEAMNHFRPDQLVIETAQLNSFQLVKAVRQHEVYHNIPICLVTGAPTEMSTLMAAEAGADTLIPSSAPAEHIVRIIKARAKRMNTAVPEATMWQA